MKDSRVKLIPVDQIEPRSREEMGDVEGLARSIAKNGQYNAIVVEESDGGDFKYTIKAGGRRHQAVLWMKMMAEMGLDDDLQEALDASGVDPSKIEVKLLTDLSPVESLVIEFEENDKRLNPKWQEKAALVRAVHNAAMEEHGRSEWSQKQTAELLSISESITSDYLKLTDNHPAVDDDVRKARTVNVAKKKLKIKKDKHRRIQRTMREQEEVEGELKASKGKKRKGSEDYEDVAEKLLFHGDAREWIKTIPDGVLDWFHWDPPYGGREGSGGAFATGEAIDIDLDYCISLMEDMIPEIHRVLHDGSWLAIWFTPAHYGWLRWYLQGHRFDKNGTCEHCGRNLHKRKDYIFMSESYSCRKSPWPFWVNPYPNLWEKTNRYADGHEIQRFLRKDTEPFLYAGKSVDRTPILPRSDHGNLFKFPLPIDRRHVNHKPKDLIKEILSDISVPGSIGGDAGVGSGSSIEAAFEHGRKILGAEIREKHYFDSNKILLEMLKEKHIGSLSKVADWVKHEMA